MLPRASFSSTILLSRARGLVSELPRRASVEVRRSGLPSVISSVPVTVRSLAARSNQNARHHEPPSLLPKWIPTDWMLDVDQPARRGLADQQCGAVFSPRSQQQTSRFSLHQVATPERPSREAVLGSLNHLRPRDGARAFAPSESDCHALSGAVCCLLVALPRSASSARASLQTAAIRIIATSTAASVSPSWA